MTLDYNIAGITFRINSSEILTENWQSKLFRMEQFQGDPDFCCIFNIVDVLPQPAGTQISKESDTILYLSENNLYQQTIDKKTGVCKLLSRCSISGSAEVALWGLKYLYPHTGRLQVLWSAVDLPYIMLQKGILTLHSSSIEVDGEAVLFVAPSGTGKSTQAYLWEKHRGARQLNGDKNCIGIKDGVVFAYGTPFSGTSECCINYELPVKAVVLIRQACVNEIHHLTGVHALKAILGNCFGHRSVPGCVDTMISILLEVLSRIPVFLLSCRPDEQSVITLENKIRKER